MPKEKKFRFVVSIKLGSHSLSSWSRYLKAVLSHDCRMFGVAPGVVTAVPGDDTTVGRESLMQQHIKDFIKAPRGATMFSTPQNVVDTWNLFVFQTLVRAWSHKNWYWIQCYTQCCHLAQRNICQWMPVTWLPTYLPAWLPAGPQLKMDP